MACKYQITTEYQDGSLSEPTALARGGKALAFKVAKQLASSAAPETSRIHVECAVTGATVQAFVAGAAA